MTRKASLDYQLPGPSYEGPMEDRSDGTQCQTVVWGLDACALLPR